MYVDFPAMFAPVMIRIWFVLPERSTSFGTNPPETPCSTTGWRPSRITSASPVFICGRT